MILSWISLEQEFSLIVSFSGNQSAQDKTVGLLLPISYVFFENYFNTNFQHSMNTYQALALKNQMNSICMSCTCQTTKQLFNNYQPKKYQKRK